MPKFLLKRWHGYQTVWAFALLLILDAFLVAYNWPLGLVCFVLIAVLGFIMVKKEFVFRRELVDYMGSLNLRIKRVEGEVSASIPLGIVLYSEDRSIEWHNPYVSRMFEEKTLIGSELTSFFPQLPFKQKDKKDGSKENAHGNAHEIRFEYQTLDRVYELFHYPEERLIYIYEITELATLREKYENEKIALGIIMLDNLDEASQGMDDQQRTALIARVASEITAWAKDYHIYLRRLSSERYLMVLHYSSLQQLEMSRFVILDNIREMTADLKVPMTLSVGLAFGSENIRELGELAQSSLDMALGRGGDQAAVKAGQRLSFYGGKTNAVEKRTRVRARVIAHALRDLMQESDRVFIMGHKMPDMDAIGASIGLWKAANLYHVECYIVLDSSNPSIDRLMEQVKKDERLMEAFILPEEAMQMMTEHSLLVVVDTHKASMTIEPKLVDSISRVVVVDHHRRGEEFINDAVLIYLEPYASSAAELVTELLQYIHDKLQLTPLEATALLAGITVDTKHFAMHTGSRTFEAAGYLRRNGADSMLVQRLLKEDLQEYIAKAEIIKHAKMMYGHIAVAVTEPGQVIPQLLIAQVADSLLNMTDVVASFVVSERPDGVIGISARSLGKMNVQVVMERLGGGGHLTNAAVQLEMSIGEAEEKLLEVLAEIEKEEGLFE
ncbi:DHH family phosphoesterase [Paenibacillus urinalis]|uniref:DHH family phosphoesterase n=1 Tax=Paenibacillus urinalis TaxID=521520 RepID=UPI001960522A